MDSWLRAIDEYDVKDTIPFQSFRSKTLAHQIRHNKCQYQDEIDALRVRLLFLWSFLSLERGFVFEKSFSANELWY